jgi:uncharacterized Zn finger protein
MTDQTDETLEDLCKDCGPTFTAFLERMAAHNKEQVEELQPKVVCPTCGKVHEFKYNDDKAVGQRR